MPELTHATREKRRECADIWAKRRPWRNQSSDALSSGPSTRGSTRAALNEPVWWEKRWFGMFVFMLDATKITDAKGGYEKQEYGFLLEDVVCEPEVHRRPKPVGQAASLQYYAVIHPEGGTIVGPDLMYWGSNKTTPANVSERHGSNFPHWCVAMAAFFTGK